VHLVKHSKMLFDSKVGIDTIKHALDTDIYNNIDIDREMSKYLTSVFANLNLKKQTQWALSMYLKDKKKDIIKAYREAKTDVAILSNEQYIAQFLGNAKEELKLKSDFFPSQFLNKVDYINYSVFETLKDALFVSDIVEEVKRDDFFRFKILVISKFKSNVKKIVDLYFATSRFIENEEDIENSDDLVIANLSEETENYILKHLDNLIVTLNSLQKIKYLIPQTLETEYILLCSSIKDFNSKEFSLIDTNEANVMKATLRQRVINFMLKLKNV